MIEAAQDAASAPASGAVSHSCAVKLPVFEGPLDLLLHLIRANEVDIIDIPIALISEQYLEYLEIMRTLDIDVAAEYLLMAATLAYIKSRMLLPPDPDAEDEAGEDPRAELARRLAEFAAYKEAAGELGGRALLGRDVFEVRPDLTELPRPEEILSVSMFSLIEAMQRVLQKLPAEERHHQVSLESVTLKDRMVRVMDLMRDPPGASVLFEDLLSDGLLSRQLIVVTFLSILELAKIQALKIFQNIAEDGRSYGPIRVRLAVEGVPDDTSIAAAADRAEAEMAGEVPAPEEPLGHGDTESDGETSE